jgi:hypothetical protein
VIALVVLWRLRYKLSLRDLAERFLIRGFVFTYEAVRDLGRHAHACTGGGAASKPKRTRRHRLDREVMWRILSIKLGALGDFVQEFHAFAAISAHHATDHVTLLTPPPFRYLGEMAPWFDASALPLVPATQNRCSD